MFCIKCGKELPNEAQFCPNCGTKVSYDTEKNTEIKRELVYAENISPKSRLIAMLLAFFLGMVGIHNFYLRRFGYAITQIIIFFLLAVLYLIAGVSLEHNAEELGVGFLIFRRLIFALSAIWAFIDFILCAGGIMKDGDGNLVKNWDEENRLDITTTINKKSEAPLEKQTFENVTIYEIPIPIFAEIVQNSFEQQTKNDLVNSYIRENGLYILKTNISSDVKSFLEYYIPWQLKNMRLSFMSRKNRKEIKIKESDWICPECETRNRDYIIKCRFCGKNKPS